MVPVKLSGVCAVRPLGSVVVNVREVRSDFLLGTKWKYL